MIRIFSDYAALGEAAAEYVVTIGKRSIGKRGKFELALSGGKTPEECYKILANRFAHEDKLWNRTEVYWADERCVPPDDPQSNYRMAKELLLDHVDIPAHQIHRIPVDAEDFESAIDRYEKEFPLGLDMLIMGIGQDGHTASIFPHSPAVTETTRHVMAVETPAEPKKRVTITPRVIANATEILVLASGFDKAEAIRQMLSDTETVEQIPAILIRKSLWFIDKPAAEKISLNMIHEQE